MKRGLTQILLGLLNPVQSSKLKVKGLKLSTFNFQLSTVILLTCIQLLAGMGAARAGTYVNNKAGVSWTDKWNEKYVPANDTASIYVLTPPTFVVAKDVRNIKTGETSTDIIQAIPDDIVEFSISITNIGETVARNIVIHDSIPAKTVYIEGSVSETASLDPIDPPDTVTFQHVAGGPFDTIDMGIVTAVKWEWNDIDGTYGNNKRTVKFRLKVLR